jgi:tetratricopeptide (TPR) repeat protein
LRFAWDWAGAKADFDRLRQLQPEAHGLWAIYYRCLGRTNEAHIEQEKWEDQDRDDLFLAYHGPASRYFEGRYDEAIREARRWPQMYTDCYYWLGRASIEKRDYTTAIEAIQKAKELWRRTDIMAQLGRAYALQGDQARAREVLTQLDGLAKADHYVDPYCVAWVYAALHQTNQALLKTVGLDVWPK